MRSSVTHHALDAPFSCQAYTDLWGTGVVKCGRQGTSRVDRLPTSDSNPLSTQQAALQVILYFHPTDIFVKDGGQDNFLVKKVTGSKASRLITELVCWAPAGLHCCSCEFFENFWCKCTDQRRLG